MVATEARKARRLAAAFAATGKADATAHVKPTPAPPPASTKDAASRNPDPKSPRDTGGRQKTYVGVGSKVGGKYTPPAILRAVANAARNKEKSGVEGDVVDAASNASSAKADWQCKCGASNFAKRRACFKCNSPQPGRKFTVAGVKGYEKRQQRREEKNRMRAIETGSPITPAGGTTPAKASAKASSEMDGKTSLGKKRKFDDGCDGGDGGDGGDDDASKPTSTSTGTTPPGAEAKTRAARIPNASEATEKRRVKGSDKGKVPKKLRDPDSVLTYLEGWIAAVSERKEKNVALDAPGFKPSNGWKLDKNVQNWLLHNLFDPVAVDAVVFQTTLLYVAGLRGGPLDRTRESAREKNAGKGVVAERARSVLRALSAIEASSAR
jgi:Rab3 GTPase-activating protein catalytic subunit